jgi:hypothetical protein
MFASICEGFWLGTVGILVAIFLFLAFGIGFGWWWGCSSATRLRDRRDILMGRTFQPQQRNFLHTAGDVWNFVTGNK